MFAARILCLCLVLLLQNSTALAQLPLTLIGPRGSEPSPTTAAAQDDAEADKDLAAMRKDVGDELRVAQRTLDAATKASGEDASPPEKLQQEVELLKQLEAIIAQQETAAAQEDDLKTKLADLKGQLEAVRMTGPQESKPYSFLLLDHLKDELSTRKNRTAIGEAALADSKQAVTRATEELEKKAQALRLLKSKLQTADDEAEKEQLAVDIKIAEADKRMVEETAELKKQQRAICKLKQQIETTQIDLLEEKIDWISKEVLFSPSDLQDQLLALDKHESDLKALLRTNESNLLYSEKEWSRSRHQLDMATAPDAVLAEQVAAQQLARQRYQQAVSLINARLQGVVKDRELWNRRFKVVTKTATPEELIAWNQDAHLLVAQLERDVRLQEMQIDEIRRELAEKGQQLQSKGDQQDEVRRWIENQKAHLSKTIQSHETAVSSINETRQLAGKLIVEIGGDVRAWSVAEWLAGAWHYFSAVWNKELVKIDDANSLTVGKLIVGVLLVFGGFIVARMLSRLLGSRLHQRLGFNQDRAEAVQSLSFYVMVALFTLFALRFVNVPLTFFTFLGGAIAISVGFGSQNILNNFISGLILLAERPIRVGDLIQIVDLYGTVEHIGTRSTRVCTGDNMEIIIPNSSFLENNVQNLTLGNNIIRSRVSVGIAYGSPTRDAARLMKRAAEEHGLVLDSPEPYVWFVEFGDNSLIFELYFWVEVRNIAERRRIESDMRFKIDHLFRDAGISIAFPQRDVHLDTASPLKVQMVAPEVSKTETPNPIMEEAA